MDYLRWFNEKTRSKLEAGKRRLLLLDGHVSHFSKAFIERAIELDIVILCYPPHSTHLLQGLNVVLFACAKAEWTKSQDQWERETGEVVTKETFLRVFGESYLAAFTPENNKKAFAKTGVHPFDRSVIKPTDLAPSIKHSKHATLPLEVPQDIEDLIQLYRESYGDMEHKRDTEEGWSMDSDAIDNNSSGGEDNDGDNHTTREHALLYGTQPSTHQSGVPAPVNSRRSHSKQNQTLYATPAHQHFHKSLEKSTSLQDLANTSPSRAPAKLPKCHYLRPATEVDWMSLPRPARSAADEANMLQDMLLFAQRHDKEYAISLQAAHTQLALAGMYAEACRKHAAAASKKKQGSKGRRLNGSGWARIVSDLQLVAEIDRVDAGEAEAECEKASHQQARLDRLL